MYSIYKKIIVISIFFLILFFPEISIKGSKDGLLLWYNTIIPTLLPFIILSNTMILVDAIEYFTFLFYPIYKIIPRLLDCFASLIFIGLFCGYPMGAKMIDDFIAQRKLSRSQGLFLLCICNNASPMFLIGYVGVAILKHSISIPVLLACIYLPVLLFFFLGVFFRPSLILMPKYSSSSFVHKNVHDEMDVMADSFAVILKIGGYIMLFSIFVRFLLILPIPDYPLKAFLLGMSEITTGIQYINILHIDEIKKTALIGAAAAFGGLSSVAQTKSVLSQSKLSILPYVIVKLLLSTCTYFLFLGHDFFF